MALALAAAGQFAEIANLEIARTVFGLSELITESSEVRGACALTPSSVSLKS